MIYTRLEIYVETSDQYGTGKNIFVGIFDNSDELEKAIQYVEKKYSRVRTVIKKYEISPNINYVK